jgi:hypothetical protein
MARVKHLHGEPIAPRDPFDQNLVRRRLHRPGFRHLTLSRNRRRAGSTRSEEIRKTAGHDACRPPRPRRAPRRPTGKNTTFSRCFIRSAGGDMKEIRRFL